jgi:hypothetical protein
LFVGWIGIEVQPNHDPVLSYSSYTSAQFH